MARKDDTPNKPPPDPAAPQGDAERRERSERARKLTMGLPA